MDAMAAFAQLGRIDLADNDLAGVLGQVAELARAAIPGAVAVGVTLVQAGVAGTAAYTGDIALSLDERQYDAGFGPCLNAAADHGINIITDTRDEDRWTAFAAAAVDVGVLSTLSVGIPIRDSVTGALNIYAGRSHAFDDDAVALARTFAGYAAVAIANAHLYETTAALAEQMSEAMRTRAVIEQAKGILIAQQHVSPDVAFNMLSQASQTANRKLRDIAQAIVDREQGER
jgi:GAF domain-containing protein